MSEPKVYREVHRVDLSDAEVAEAADHAAQRQGELLRLEAEFDALKKVRKGQIDEMSAEIRNSLRHVRERAAELEIRVIHTNDWELGIVSTVAIDRSGVEVHRRPLTESESQRHLFDVRGEDVPADDGAIDGGAQDVEDRAPAGA